jgi:membrane-associated protein
VARFFDQLLSSNAWVVYTLVAMLVFAEDALFLGFVIPGETAAVIGGVAASRGHVEFGAMVGLVVIAAIAGDSVGYEVGRHFGPRLLNLAPMRRHQHRLADAQAFMSRRGGAAVFLGRFVAFFRAVMPALAGASHMPYRRFLPWNAAGGLVWGITFVSLGYLAGNSYARVEKILGRDLALAVAAVAVAALIVWRVRRSRSRRTHEVGGPPDHSSGPC